MVRNSVIGFLHRALPVQMAKNIYFLIRIAGRYRLASLFSTCINPWRYRLWRTLAGWAAAAGSFSRLHQTVLGWHMVSTSNPTAAFSAFQTGPLFLYFIIINVFSSLMQGDRLTMEMGTLTGPLYCCTQNKCKYWDSVQRYWQRKAKKLERKLVLVQVCPQQIPHGQPCVVRSRWLTALTITRLQSHDKWDRKLTLLSWL
jgi:hypothetical protein